MGARHKESSEFGRCSMTSRRTAAAAREHVINVDDDDDDEFCIYIPLHVLRQRRGGGNIRVQSTIS